MMQERELLMMPRVACRVVKHCADVGAVQDRCDARTQEFWTGPSRLSRANKAVTELRDCMGNRGRVGRQ